MKTDANLKNLKKGEGKMCVPNCDVSRLVTQDASLAALALLASSNADVLNFTSPLLKISTITRENKLS